MSIRSMLYHAARAKPATNAVLKQRLLRVGQVRVILDPPVHESICESLTRLNIIGAEVLVPALGRVCNRPLRDAHQGKKELLLGRVGDRHHCYGTLGE